MITTNQIKFFNNYGYLTINNLFIKKEIKSYLNSAKEIQKTFDERIYKYYEKSFFDKKKNILIRAENFYNIDFNLTKLINNKKITKILEKLFNDKAIIFKEKINYKPAGARKDKLHQDSQAGWNKFTKKFISVLIPLEKSHLLNGCLQFDISGNNHKKMIGKTFKTLKLDELKKPKFKYFELNIGDVIFFNNYIPHKSNFNKSKNSRIQIYLTYNKKKDGNFRKKYISEKITSYPPNNMRRKNIKYLYKI
jgi:ectoine hydroxylase-related dioxygenase (phytanoyl-CoA dioxygenase family)